MEIKTLPAKYGIDIWQESWNLIAGKRLVFFFTVVVMMVLNFVLAVIPVIGMPLQGLLAPFLGAGFILIVHQYNTENRFRFETLFEALTDKSIFSKILPLALFLMIWNALFAVVQFVGGSSDLMGGAITVLSSLLISIFTYFAIPLMLFNNEGLFSAMSLSAQALTYNMIMFLVYSVVLILVMTIGMIPVGIGVLLMLAPLNCHIYLFYLHIFDQVESIE